MMILLFILLLYAAYTALVCAGMTRLAFAVKSFGVRDAYPQWRRGAAAGEAPRTAAAFLRALAEFDRFLLQPENPEELIGRYQASWQLHWVARYPAVTSDSERGMAEVRRALTEARESASGTSRGDAP